MDWKSLFFSANGRIGRRAFWIGFAILFGAGLVINVVPVFGQLLSLAMIWCWVCLFSKRLHDMGRSGWLTLAPVVAWFLAAVIATFVGGAGLIAAAVAGEHQGAAAFLAAMGGVVLVFGVAGLINLGFILWVGLSDPTPGDNAYGPHPADGPSGAIVS